MDSLYILDKLKMEENCKIEGAIFLTYSIDCKSILAVLLKMFTNDSKIQSDEKKKNDKRKALTNRFQNLLENGMGNGKTGVEAYAELKNNVAFVCNDGYDKSISSPIYWYTKDLTYYYKTEHSFHPKLFIVKYSKPSSDDSREPEIYFRIMVASMNLVDSHNLDMMMVKDIRAYNDQGTNRVNCTILNELLDYDSDPNAGNDNNLICISNRKEGLKQVLNNLNLHGLFFDKKDLPEFLVFTGKNEPMKEKKIIQVMSPFLSDEYALKNEIAVYTMESELNKNGWFKCEDELNKEELSAPNKEFYVYQSENNEIQFNHTKLYVVEEQEKESIYIGSTNFSKAAFENNKEILVKLDINDSDEFKNYLFNEATEQAFRYVKKTFKQQKQEGKDEEEILRELFKKLSSIFSMNMSQEIIKNNNGFNCNICINNLCENKVSKIIAKKQNIITNKSSGTNIKITIVPFMLKNESLDVGEIANGKLKIAKTPIVFSTSDRRLIDEKFIFKYTYEDGNKVVGKDYIFSIKTKGIENAESDNTNSEYMLTFLQTFLSEKKTNDSMLTKDLDRVMQGNTISLSNYCSKLAIPELEEMLKKWLSDSNYKPSGQRIEEISKLLSNNNLTDTEKKNFGVTAIDEKMITSLCEQWKKLKSEIE